MATEELVVAVIVNDAYVSHLGTLLYSLAKHHSETKVTVYVCHEALSEHSLQDIRYICDSLPGITVKLLSISAEQLAAFPIKEGSQWPKLVYARLLLADLLPHESRILYLDLDVLVVDSLVPLWETDLQGNVLAAVPEVFIGQHTIERLAEMSFPEEATYFNSGVLLMDLQCLRNGGVNSLKELVAEKGETFSFPDQDALNLCFWDKTLLLDKAYNYHNDFLMMPDERTDQKVIIHYGGSERTKPWTNSNKIFDYIKPAVSIYRQYREEFLQQLSGYYPRVTAMVAVPAQSHQHWLEGLDSLLLQTYPNLQIQLLCQPEDYEEVSAFVNQSHGRARISIQTTEQDLLNSITSDFVYIGNILDVLEKDCIQHLMTLQTKYQAELVVGDYYTFNPEDGLLYFHAKRDEAELITGEMLPSETWFEQLEGKLFLASMLKDKQLLELADWRQLTRIVISEKQDYLLRIGERQSYRELYHLSLPMISVVIAAYNVALYLEECLNSVLKQTYTNWEVVLVNDGSTDETRAIADRYAAQDSRFRVFHRENGGASVAKNYGIKQAGGEFVTLLDSDDILYEKDMFQVLLKHGREHQADIVIGNYFEFDEGDGNFYYRNLDGDFIIEEVSAQEAINRQANWRHLNTSAFIITAGKLIRRCLFEGVSFPIGRVFDDEYLTHKLYIKAEKILLVNGNYYLYRRRKNSIMHSGFSIKRAQDVMYVFQDKLSDLVLAGYDTHEMRLRYRNILNDYKRDLEYHGMTDTVEYEEICFKLSLIKE